MRSRLIPRSTRFLPEASPWRLRTWLATVTALSLLTLLIHGYHPFAEDGGLYVAGVEYTLDPTLFPHYTAFVTEHLGFSLFAPLLATCVHLTHLTLDAVLLLAELVSLALTFFAAHQLLRRCIASEAAQLAGLALLAAWWTLPIAGTSLLMMDPYLTARSFSTPLTLLAISFALDPWSLGKTGVAHPSPSQRKEAGTSLLATPATLCILTLLAAAIFHPLMAAYAAAFVLALRLRTLRNHRIAWTSLRVATLAFTATLQRFAPTEDPATVAAAISRYYWFLSQWQWYELLGLAGPLIIVSLLLRWQRTRLTPAAETLLRTSIFLGLLATLIALLFAHRDAATHLVARLQPLRIFLPIYAIMTLLLGATLMQSLLGRIARTESAAARRTLAAIPLLTFAALAATFFFVQRQTYTTSPQVEFPGGEARNTNTWVEAFLWARANTPADALFALDAKYVNQDVEDAQTFRAWSLRSALPDFSKDGGEAAITPSLAASWLPTATAQQGLSNEDDNQRDARILPLGATWMIVRSTTPTRHPCPYSNPTIKVCRLTR
jgi:hypothetical protein